MLLILVSRSDARNQSRTLSTSTNQLGRDISSTTKIKFIHVPLLGRLDIAIDLPGISSLNLGFSYLYPMVMIRNVICERMRYSSTVLVIEKIHPAKLKSTEGV